MMHRTENFDYALHETYQVQSVELLYAGEEASLIILLPAKGKYEQFEDALSADLVSEISKQNETQPPQAFRTVLRVHV